MFNVFISKVDTKTLKFALEHHDWVFAMQAELVEFDRNKFLKLIPQ